MSQREATNRIEELSQDLIFEVIAASTHNIYHPAIHDSYKHYDVFDQLPKELSADEIVLLGLRVSSLTEQVFPSYDGFSHGKKNESRMNRWLGFMAFRDGDGVTTQSSVERLKALGGLNNRLVAILIHKT